MGEYATYHGQSVKIGTCEDMLYLRADQVLKVRAERGSVDPFKQSDGIRFRFPFPQEDGIEPGAFEPFYSLGLHGVEVPDGVEHHNLQFSRNYPRSGGVMLSTPCPESAEGKASGLRFQYNGYSGKVAISQQRLIDGKLVLICECGSCGAKYRYPTLAECEPVVDALLKEAAAARGPQQPSESRAQYYEEVARRIIAGYTGPNAWNLEQFQAA